MYERFIKRVFDILISLMIIIILSPLYIIVGILNTLIMGFPVLFTQERIGQNENIFTMYKFRSMKNARNENEYLLNDQERLTKYGIFIRSTSIDELPEVFNILKGEMSFIGPRPLPAFYMPFYKEEERIRHRVRGGLLPPDSLSEKVFTTWDEELYYDIYYVNNQSFLLDLKIFTATLVIIVKRIAGNYGAEIRPHLSEERAEIHL